MPTTVLPVQDLDNMYFWLEKFWTDRMTISQTKHSSYQSRSGIISIRKCACAFQRGMEDFLFMAYLFAIGKDLDPSFCSFLGQECRKWSSNVQNKFKQIKRMIRFADWQNKAKEIRSGLQVILQPALSKTVDIDNGQHVNMLIYCQFQVLLVNQLLELGSSKQNGKRVNQMWYLSDRNLPVKPGLAWMKARIVCGRECVVCIKTFLLWGLWYWPASCVLSWIHEE